LNEKEIEQYVMNPTNDEFIQKMNRYLLYFRMGNNFEWEIIPENKDHFDVVNKTKVVHKEKAIITSIASKNVFKGNMKVELICSFLSFKVGHFTCSKIPFFNQIFFIHLLKKGVITSQYKNWNTYSHTGDSGKGSTNQKKKAFFFLFI
jgi:hypothetical protein